MIVLLTEEPSMREYLEIIVSELWPNSIPGVDLVGSVVSLDFCKLCFFTKV